jgi:5'-methylthioadenosine phosphorylase
MNHIGILGGSGLYNLPGLRNEGAVTITTPFGEPSGPIRTGEVGNTRFYFLARHGDGHRIPPSAIPYRANIWALKSAGAKQLVSVSAVGSLREELRPGDVVMVDQYIDRTRGRIGTFFDAPGIVAHVSLADPTCSALSGALAAAAASLGAAVHRAGTYLCMEGPQFSTRAESRLHRNLGADVVGMTNMPEAKLAREAELPYASMCFVTDYDAWRESGEAVSLEHVLAVLHANVDMARRILASDVAWPDPAQSAAASALRDALITQRDAVSPHERERLGLLVGRYLGIDGV